MKKLLPLLILFVLLNTTAYPWLKDKPTKEDVIKLKDQLKKQGWNIKTLKFKNITS